MVRASRPKSGEPLVQAQVGPQSEIYLKVSLFCFMYFVYILFSASLNKYYVGYTHDVDQRVYKHHRKHKGFTASAHDWMIVYTETFDDKTKAILREKEIKNWKSRKMIEKLIHAHG